MSSLHINLSTSLPSLVQLQEVLSLSEVLSESLRVAHTLESRVHEACVAKVTETSGSGGYSDICTWTAILHHLKQTNP